MSSMEAHQTEPSTLLFDVWVVANATRALLDHALRPSGLSAEDFALYSAIRRGGNGITPSELAELMGLAPTTISSAVSRLESRTHICRLPNPADARSYRIKLTAAGRSAHAAATKLFIPVLHKVETELGLPVHKAQNVLSALNSAVRSSSSALDRGKWSG